MTDYSFWLAVIPGVFLLWKIYKKDRIEKEPIRLILWLLLLGAVSIIPSVIAELLAEEALAALTGYSLEAMEAGEMAPLAYRILENFIGVGLVEEFFKYVLLKKGSWKNKAFDYQFDGVVYAVCVSMGFAILENVLYVAEEGFAVAIMRMLTAVPMHCIFAVFMGHYYGLAKAMEAEGNKLRMRMYLFKAVLGATLLHGLYDFLCGEAETYWYILIIFLIVLDLIALGCLEIFSEADVRIYKEPERQDDVWAMYAAQFGNDPYAVGTQNPYELSNAYSEKRN